MRNNQSSSKRINLRHVGNKSSEGGSGLDTISKGGVDIYLEVIVGRDSYGSISGDLAIEEEWDCDDSRRRQRVKIDE